MLGFWSDFGGFYSTSAHYRSQSADGTLGKEHQRENKRRGKHMLMWMWPVGMNVRSRLVAVNDTRDSSCLVAMVGDRSTSTYYSSPFLNLCTTRGCVLSKSKDCVARWAQRFRPVHTQTVSRLNGVKKNPVLQISPSLIFCFLLFVCFCFFARITLSPAHNSSSGTDSGPLKDENYLRQRWIQTSI